MNRTSFRVLAGALILSVVVIVYAIWLVMPDASTTAAGPPTAALAGVVALGVLQGVLLEVIGYRLPALPTSTPPEELAGTALVRFRDAMLLRFVLAESVAIVAIAAGFVVASGGLTVVTVGGGITLLLLAVHVWPWRRPVERSAAALERDGARSGLREVFGQHPGGVVREL